MVMPSQSQRRHEGPTSIVSQRVRRRLALTWFIVATVVLILGQLALIPLHSIVGPAYAEEGIEMPQASIMLFDYIDWMRSGDGLGTVNGDLFALPFPAAILVVPLGLLALMTIGLVLARTMRLLLGLGIVLLYGIILGQFALLILPYFSLLQSLLDGEL